MPDTRENIADVVHHIDGLGNRLEPDFFRDITLHRNVIDDVSRQVFNRGIGGILKVQGPVLFLAEEPSEPDAVAVERLSKLSVEGFVVLTAVEKVQSAADRPRSSSNP